MYKFIKKNKYHLLIWLIMLGYFGSASNLFTQFVLKNGKPIQFEEQLPKPSEEIKLTIDGLTLYIVEGQTVYALSGWAFSVLDKDISPGMYERVIVLTSDSNTYFFLLKLYNGLAFRRFIKI